VSSRNNDDKTDREYRADRWVSIFTIVLVAGIAFSFIFWPDRNFVQLTTSLITALGVVLTLRATQIRSIEQQEREDIRHHERLRAEAQKDSAQRSITQRINLAEKLASAIEHISSDNELQQAAGVQEILFQIDDWHALIKSEIAGLVADEKGVEIKKEALKQESLRRRQELFDIAYKFDTKNIHVLKFRAIGLKQRLRKEGPGSLADVDFSEMVINNIDFDDNAYRPDLRGIHAAAFKMVNCKMKRVDLIGANLSYADLQHADFEGAVLFDADLESVNLLNAKLVFSKLNNANLSCADLHVANLEIAALCNTDLTYANLGGANLKRAIFRNVILDLTDLGGAILAGVFYDNKTSFPKGFVPQDHGMILLDEMET
jgi:pentapeptide repeat protein